MDTRNGVGLPASSPQAPIPPISTPVPGALHFLSPLACGSSGGGRRYFHGRVKDFRSSFLSGAGLRDAVPLFRKAPQPAGAGGGPGREQKKGDQEEGTEGERSPGTPHPGNSGTRHRGRRCEERVQMGDAQRSSPLFAAQTRSGKR